MDAMKIIEVLTFAISTPGAAVAIKQLGKRAQLGKAERNAVEQAILALPDNSTAETIVDRLGPLLGGAGGSVHLRAGDNGGGDLYARDARVLGGDGGPGARGGDVHIQAGDGGPNGPGANVSFVGGTIQGGKGGDAPKR